MLEEPKVQRKSETHDNWSLRLAGIKLYLCQLSYNILRETIKLIGLSIPRPSLRLHNPNQEKAEIKQVLTMGV